MNKRLEIDSRYIILLLLMSITAACSPKLAMVDKAQQLYLITTGDPKDDKLAEFVRPYKIHLDSQMNQVIATAPIEIAKAKPEGLLNNLVADAMAASARLHHITFDLAYTNYGGLRIGFPAGQIRMFSVFELMPFENLLTTVEFKGSDLLKLFHYMAENGGDPISGARFVIRDKRPEDVTINGEPLDPDRVYTVLTSDYMANGGDQAAFFKDASGRKEHNIKLRDAILNYVKSFQEEGKLLEPIKDGRITVK